MAHGGTLGLAPVVELGLSVCAAHVHQTQVLEAIQEVQRRCDLQSTIMPGASLASSAAGG